MVHGIALSGAALMAMAAALFALRAMPGETTAAQWRPVSWLLVFVAVILWTSVLTGTFVVFPPYRVPPPDGLADLTAHPRALLLASQDTRWLHAFGMEIKEHVPWIAAMLATAGAFVGVRYRATLAGDGRLRTMVAVMLAIAFVLVAFVGVLGTLVNKVAPLE
jgi:hypothetical protein